MPFIPTPCKLDRTGDSGNSLCYEYFKRQPSFSAPSKGIEKRQKGSRDGGMQLRRRNCSLLATFILISCHDNDNELCCLVGGSVVWLRNLPEWIHSGQPSLRLPKRLTKAQETRASHISLQLRIPFSGRIQFKPYAVCQPAAQTLKSVK